MGLSMSTISFNGEAFQKGESFGYLYVLMLSYGYGRDLLEK